MEKTIQQLMPKPADIEDVAIEGRNLILKRTKQGNDVNGAQFADYSTAYLRHREKLGKTTYVNLEYDNKMLGSMSVKRITGGAEIYFSDAERRKIAIYHNSGTGVPERKFFAISDGEAKDLIERLMKKLRARSR